MTEVKYQFKRFDQAAVKEVRDWCNYNTKSHWHYVIGEKWTDTFHFDDPADALYFGIYWKCGN